MTARVPEFVVNVQVAVLCNERILIIRRGDSEAHAKGVLDLPGGKLEQDELGAAVLERVATREVLEETGVDLSGSLFRYVCSSLFDSDDGFRVVNIVLCTSVELETETRPDQETAFAGWLEVAEVVAEPSLPPWTADYISRALAHNQNSCI